MTVPFIIQFHLITDIYGVNVKLIIAWGGWNDKTGNKINQDRKHEQKSSTSATEENLARKIFTVDNTIQAKEYYGTTINRTAYGSGGQKYDGSSRSEIQTIS